MKNFHKNFRHIFLSLTAALLFWAPPAFCAENEKIVLCQGGSKQSLYTIALKLGFFSDVGLDAEVKNFTVGLLAFNGLLEDKCDYASAAEMPFIVHSFSANDVVIVATTRSSNDQSWILARADKGVARVEDLAGKKLGVPKGTAPHYFLELMLQKHGLGPDEYVEKFLPVDEIEKQLLEGTIDAITLPALQTSRVAKKLGAKGIVFREPGLCLNFGLLQTKRRTIAERPELTVKVLKALIEAERFMIEKPDEARKIIIETSGFTPEEYDEIMRENSDAVTLPNGLLLTMEDNARWAIERKLVVADRVPNFLNSVEDGPLKSLAPKAVGLAR